MNQLKRLRKSGSKKSLVKKYNVPSQITTRSSSKKNNKIYSHNDDDVDNDLHAKNMIIERVNDDCLAEIFMYVPACERPKISLVCKKWKRALDKSWSNVKKLELTHWEYDENPHFLKRNYPTIDGQFSFLKSLLYKCGRYLRELDLSVYGYCNIVPVINENCPNLVKLRIRIDDRLHLRNARFDNAFSHLSKLKVLKIIFHRCFNNLCPPLPTTLINSLLDVADTLTDLNISYWPRALHQRPYFSEEMTSVISQQKALRKFSTTGIGSLKSLCDYLDNSKTITCTHDHVCFTRCKIGRLELIENVEKLDIVGRRITDDGIYAIANTMKRLRILRVSCILLTDTGIVTCTKMNNLKYLEFNGFSNATDSSIELLKNLTHLMLPVSNKITDESAIKILENSPDMIEYCIRDIDITYKFIEKAAEISGNRERKLNVYTTLDPNLSNTQIKYEYLTVHYFKKEILKETNSE